MLSLLTIVALSSTFTFIAASDETLDLSLEDELTGIPPDDLSHDCKTILPIDHANFKKNPILAHLKKIKPIYVKYNHAYGIPVFGVANFKADSMLRACYLLRYMFAGNEWLRRYGKKSKMYLSGYKGGWCCPPQMGNKGLSCSCERKINPNSTKVNSYPILGKGAPAHEMAHWFIKRVLEKMAIDGVLKIPDFQDDEYRKYNSTKYMNKTPKYIMSDFLLNSYYQDKARKSTKIRDAKLHHYFIYTGQQNFIINNYGLQKTLANRQKLKEKNKNLYALLKEIWQCDNSYITVCKDGNYGFTKGLNQVMNIGKADPNNPQKMICSKDLDKPELETVDPIIMPTGDYKQKPGFEKSGIDKCGKVIRKGGWGKVKDLKSGVVEQRLGDDDGDEGNEFAWWLRKCCAKTAKFSFVK